MNKPEKLLHRIPAPFLPAALVQKINQHEKLIMYGLIGGVAVIIDVGLFWVFDAITDWPVVMSNALSIFIAMVYSFTMNAFFNFKTRTGLGKRFLSFALVTFIGYGVSSIMLWGMVELLSFNSVVAKNLTLPVVFLVQFYLNSKFTFKTDPPAAQVAESIV